MTKRCFQLVAAMGFLGLASAGFSQVSVTTWRNDNARTGQYLSETLLTPTNVNSTNFGKLFSYPVDGYVYAQPLYVSKVAIPGKGTYNVVYVATQHNSVYAFNADSATGGTNGLFWKVNLGTSAPTPNNDFGNRYGAYADIRPEIGITGTPVIDQASSTLYLVAFTAENGTYVHRLHALDITTGAEKFGGPMVISASVSGTGAGSSGGTLAFLAKQHLQRGGLTLSNGIVYIPYSGIADTDPYHGWVLGYTANTLQRVRTFNTTPNGSETGIWMGGAGLVVDSSNNLFALTGNGTFTANTGGSSYGESFLKLSSTSLSVLDYFTPYNQADLSAADADLGSGGLLLLPDQAGTYPHLIMGGGKEGRIYLVNRDNMSKYSSSGDKVVQSVSGAVTRIFNTPAYFNGLVYYIGSYDYLKAFSLTNGVLSSNALAVGGKSFDFPGASPSISANGATNGIVWATLTGNPATLYAYKASNVAVQLYNSTQAGTRDQAPDGCKFSVPTVANSKVYVGGQYALAVYGLFAQAATIPNAPTNLTAATISSSRIDLGWLDNSDNEISFRVERSTDNSNFVDIGGTAANVTTYSDSALDPNTLYYYRVRASNSAGNSAYTNVASAATLSSTSVPGLVGYWKFDEGTGSVVGDSSGEGDNGTLVGEVTWVAGQPGFGNALSFHGIGQAIAHVEVPDAPHLRFTASDSFTVSAWINSGSPGTAWASVIAKSRETGTNWGLAIDATNRWVFFGSNGVVQGSVVTTGWHFLTGVQDGPAGTRVLHVDGTAVGSGTAQDATGTGDLWFANGKSVSEPFNGMIDDVRVYNRALATIEIQTLANTTWSDADIGSVGVAGSATFSSDGTFTISGSGTDIWDNADSFNYVYQQQTGDFQISARVVSMEDTDPWAKAGVMIRETLNADSKFVDTVLTPENGAAFQYRSASGASAIHVAGANVTAPYWIKLARAGNTFTGSISSDGASWSPLGSAVMAMNTTVYTGMPVTALNNSVLNTSNFDNVKVGATNAPGPISVNFQLASAPSVSGYLVDGGSVYGSRGNGQTYG
ncbi:MAG: fibronectin type III domain-containing protein, partial [Verrucomicrobiota bacterium]|nr:fibronectin type III domain-containing protein [Verrucomicrobiota bacterium]